MFRHLQQRSSDVPTDSLQTIPSDPTGETSDASSPSVGHPFKSTDMDGAETPARCCAVLPNMLNLVCFENCGDGMMADTPIQCNLRRSFPYLQRVITIPLSNVCQPGRERAEGENRNPV